MLVNGSCPTRFIATGRARTQLSNAASASIRLNASADRNGRDQEGERLFTATLFRLVGSQLGDDLILGASVTLGGPHQWCNGIGIRQIGVRAIIQQ